MNPTDLVSSLLSDVLTPQDMMRLFQVRSSRFYQLLAVGRFDAFELKPRIGPRRFSAKKVKAYFDGDMSGQSRFKRSA